MSARRGVTRAWASAFFAFVSIAGVVVAATQADGRQATESDVNDGGAWLLRRDSGQIGHVNRSVAEVTAALSVGDPGGDFDVHQAEGILLVHDRATNLVSLVDERSNLLQSATEVPPEAVVFAVDGGAVVADQRNGRTWRLSRAALLDSQSLDDIAPLSSESGGSVVVAAKDGTTAISADGAVLVFTDDALAPRTVAGVSAPAPERFTIAGDRAISVNSSGDLTLDGEPISTGVDLGESVLEQPSSDRTSLAFVAASGEIGRVDLVTGDIEQVGELPAGGPLAPIQVGACIYAVSTDDPTLVRVCEGSDDLTRPLDGDGASLRLRLVNGWVWVNDVDSGSTWVIGPDTDLERVDDWAQVLPRNTNESDNENANGGGEEELRQDPDATDAELEEADRLDLDENNEAPQAIDDDAETRIDRPVVIEVLSNDSDPDGDVILIDGVSNLPEGHVISPTAARNAIQVTPLPGFVGTMRFDYTISDSGGLTSTATVTLQVSAADADLNRPPTAVTDVAATRPGEPASLNLLDNDSDPDGDSLVLTGVEGDGGSIRWSPDGGLVFVPDTTGTDAQITLTYTVVDDFNAASAGRVLVNIRLEDSNQSPDARNDSALGIVGRPVTLNALANDTDADGDALFVSAQPTLVRPADAAIDRLSLSPDGEFFFVPPTAGTWVFTYSVSDGPDSDQAQIRIDVEEPQANRPPVAVRDDVVIPVGATRVVYVLENDGDPDGDVVSIIETFPGNDQLEIEELPGIGYRIKALAEAPERSEFRYSISDGLSDPVVASVVVSAPRNLDVSDQAPVVRPDVIELRAGRTTSIPVLLNDFDPEGGSLRVVGTTEGPDDVSISVDGTEQRVVISVPIGVDRGFIFSYDAADEAGNQSAAEVRVRIVFPDEPNRAPQPLADIGRTIEEVPVVVPVLLNDFDPDGDELVVESISAQPVNGTAIVLGDGTVLYTPRAGTSGTDRFSYVIADTEGERAVGDVLVGVMPKPPENLPPNAVNDGPIPIPVGSAPVALDVLLNDSDPDGDTLAIIDVEEVRVGSVLLNEDGTAITFSAPAELSAGPGEVTVAFRYTIDDGRGLTDTAQVTLVLSQDPEPVAPVAVDDVAGPVKAGDAITIPVLANDRDPDGAVEDLVVSSSDASVAIVGQQIQIVAPATSAQFTYTITDLDGLSATATVSLTVVENQAPVVTPFSSDVEFESPLTITLTGQATDADGDELIFVCCDSAQSGSATPISQGSGVLQVTFTPDGDFSGAGGFSYTVDDQNGHIVSGVVSLTILPPENTAPEATDGTSEVEQGQSATVDLAALVSDVDLEAGDVLTFSADPASGTGYESSLSGSVLTITSTVEARPGETFDIGYTVTDSFDETASANVAVSIVETEADPPVANDDTASTFQGQEVTISPLGNDLGTGLTIVSATGATGGTATINGAGDEITFTPNSTFFGSTTLTYRIRDEFDLETREVAGQITIEVIGFPDAPTPPVGQSLISGEVPLTWTTPASNGSPISAYELEHNRGGSSSLGNVNGYNWTGLTNGQAYQFRIRATNEAGQGEWSAWSADYTPDEVPGRPSAPTLEFLDQALQVDWIAPSNDGSAITSYTLEIGGGTSSSISLGSTPSHTWSNLSNGVGYQFRVRATNAAGDGEWGPWSTTETPLREPDAPAQPVAARGQQFLDVTWTAPADNGDPITSYEVRIVSSGQVSTVVGSARNYRWSDLPNGVEQSFEVRAKNRDEDWGAWSTPSAPVKPCDVPDPVVTLSALRGDGQATVDWTAPDSQGCDITGYVIRNSAGTSQNAPAGATSHTFTGLTNATSYTFTVEAQNEEGSSATGTTSNAVIPAGPPIGPSSATATATGVGQITVSWPAANANGGLAFGYLVSLDGGATYQSAGTNTSVVRTGLAEGTTYNVRVRATNDVGDGPVASAGSVATWGRPSVPAGLNLSAGNAQATASFNAAAANGSAVIEYEIDINPGGSETRNATSHTFTGLSNGTSYTFRVRARNAVGWSNWSGNSNTATPAAPRVLTLTNTQQPAPFGKWVSVSASGFTPNVTYTVTCYTRFGESFWSQNAAMNGSGAYTDSQLCYADPGLWPLYATLTRAGEATAVSNRPSYS